MLALFIGRLSPIVHVIFAEGLLKSYVPFRQFALSRSFFRINLQRLKLVYPQLVYFDCDFFILE
jgi:hypothetical protein